MEGDQTQQIRTMAGDLARAQHAGTQKPTGELVLDIAKKPMPQTPPLVPESEKQKPVIAPIPPIPPVVPVPPPMPPVAPMPPPIPPRPIPPKPPTPPQLPIHPKSPITPEPPTIALKPRSLSDILDDARKRAEQPSAPPLPVNPVPLPIKPATPQTDDILPIEDVAEIKKAEPKAVEPPDNLPTSDEKTPAPRVPELPIAGEALSLPPIPPRPSDQMPISTPKTPEEILGLSAKPPAKPVSPAPEYLARAAESMRESVKAQSEAKQRVAPIPPPASSPAKPTAKKTEALPGPKFAIIGGALGLITIVVLGVLIWKIFIQEPPPPPPPPKPTGPIEQPMPQALIEYDKIETIAIGKLNYDSLKPLLDSLHLSEPAPDSLTYVPIKLSGSKEINYLTLAEFLTTLQIDAPPTFADYKDYTLFLYNQKNSAAETCTKAKITSELCVGPRLGLVIKLPEIPKEDQPEALYALPEEVAKSAMREWEKTLVQDLRPLMLFVPQNTDSAQFEIGEHKSFGTRYINLPIHTMSIDWILTEHHLIIATSKDAARAAMDRLVK